jgi:glycosyltransferase involved in cell wall biosynthesis
MNILILSKRQYMGKDLLDDEYGRFYEIPKHLASMGHRVTGICLSYRKRDERLFNDNQGTSDSVAWHSINLTMLPPRGIFRYITQLDKIIEATRPDIVYGCSDAIHVILASYVAGRHRLKLVVDLYDNFESYTVTKIPGIRPSFIKSLTNADGISAVSERLRGYITAQYEIKQPVLVLGNAINKDLFISRNKAQCRAALGLPDNAILIGTAGALYKNRDILTLFSAFEMLRQQDNRIHIVLAGPRDKTNKLPAGDNVHDLGMLEHSDVATMYGALDLGITCNIDSEFGRYCYPQKFFEILACNIPVIAASVGTLQDMLENYSYALYIPGNPESLASGIQNLLANPRIPDLLIPDWGGRARELDYFFQEIARIEHP